MRYLPALIFVVLLLAGCASEPAANPQDGQLVMPMSIVGEWNVARLEGTAGVVPPPAGRSPSIDFAPQVGAAGGRVDIYTGVNQAGGKYFFGAGERDIGALTVERLVATMRAGSAEAMAYESALMAALGSARTAQRDANGLVIECGDARIYLVRRKS
jgi:heat shock protein HslJ